MKSISHRLFDTFNEFLNNFFGLNYTFKFDLNNDTLKRKNLNRPRERHFTHKQIIL